MESELFFCTVQQRIHRILAAMRSNQGNRGVQKDCCSALDELTADYWASKCILAEGGIDLITVAIRDHGTNAKVRRTGMDALANLVMVKKALEDNYLPDGSVRTELAVRALELATEPVTEFEMEVRDAAYELKTYVAPGFLGNRCKVCSENKNLHAGQRLFCPNQDARRIQFLVDGHSAMKNGLEMLNGVSGPLNSFEIKKMEEEIEKMEIYREIDKERERFREELQECLLQECLLRVAGMSPPQLQELQECLLRSCRNAERQGFRKETERDHRDKRDLFGLIWRSKKTERDHRDKRDLTTRDLFGLIWPITVSLHKSRDALKRAEQLAKIALVSYRKAGALYIDDDEDIIFNDKFYLGMEDCAKGSTTWLSSCKNAFRLTEQSVMISADFQSNFFQASWSWSEAWRSGVV